MIPVYNVKHDFLNECIDSILANNFQDMEIILVDDCSTNGCEKLCEKYTLVDNNFIL